MGIPLIILLPQKLLPLLAGIAGHHRDLKIAIDHLALTNGLPFAETFKDFDLLLTLARHANVAIRASALPCYAADGYPFKRVQAYARSAFEAFGPQRFFWGSDLSRSPVPYRQQVEMWLNDAPWLNEADRRMVLGQGLCTWLNWPVD